MNHKTFLINSSAGNEVSPMFRFYVFFLKKKRDAYGVLMYCFSGGVFSLTEQLVDICLSDESDNDLLFHNEDDQPKIITDRFLLIHSTS